MANVQLSTLGAVIKTAYEGEADTNAFTDAEQTKLAGVEAQATKNATDAELRDRATHTGAQAISTITGLQTALDGKEPADSTILKDADIGVTLQPYNANTVVDASYVHTDNNYTTTEKSKLAGVAEGAEVNVNADWNATSGDAQILNKPTTISGYGITDAYTKTEVDTISGLLEARFDDMNEPTGFNRPVPNSMGILELCESAASGAYHRIDQNSVYSYITGATTFGDGVTPLGDRTVVHRPVAGNTIDVWVAGEKYSFNTTQVVQLTAVSGMHYCYYTSAGLQGAANFNPEYFQSTPITCVIYGNAGTGEKVVFADERHGIQMDGATHRYLHFTQGTQYYSGLGLNGLVAGGTGYTSIGAGVAYDEDIIINAGVQTDSPFWYIDGTSWRGVVDGTLLGYKGAGTQCKYNLDTAGNWSLVDVANGDYLVTHFVLTNDKQYPVVKILGQQMYATVANARAGIEAEISALNLVGLPSPEMVFIGSVIISGAGQLQTLADGSLYLDLRTTDIRGIGGTSGTTTIAADVIYSNTTSGLSATNVQTAIDELASEKADKTDTYTKSETNTQISTAISNLVDTAPTTLDTLNELAAALGDDPNFATTVTNSIATKVTSNTAITAGTATKITYDTKGLVTAGTTLIESDIPTLSIAKTTGLQTALDGKVAKVTSTDNAIVRFNGTTGEVQNSSVTIDDSNNLLIYNNSYLNLGANQGGGATLKYNENGNLDITPRDTYDTIITRGDLGVSVANTSPWGGTRAVEVGLAGAFYGDGIYEGWWTGIAQNAYRVAGGEWRYRNTGIAVSRYELFNGAGADGSHTWYTAPSGTAGNPITWTTAMTLDASGNLSISGEKLNIGGTSNNAVINANFGMVFNVDADNNGTEIFKWGTNGNTTASTILMTLTDAGNLSLNTTNAYSKFTNNGSLQTINNGSYYCTSGAATTTDLFSDRGENGGDGFYHRFNHRVDGGWWGFQSEYQNDAGAPNTSFFPFRYVRNGTTEFSVSYNGGINTSGYTKLGSDAPAIKYKKLTFTSASTEGGSVQVTHGLTTSKIISVTVAIRHQTEGMIFPNTTATIGAGYEFEYYLDSGGFVYIKNHTTNSENILSKSGVITIMYEE
jgi:hypothetical protein